MELNVRSSHDCIVELTMICCQQNLPAKSDFPATLTEKEVIEEDGGGAEGKGAFSSTKFFITKTSREERQRRAAIHVDLR